MFCSVFSTRTTTDPERHPPCGVDVTAERDHRGSQTNWKNRRLAPGRKVRVDTAADMRARVMQNLPAGIHLKTGEPRD
jgi:hypothetical protein